RCNVTPSRRKRILGAWASVRRKLPVVHFWRLAMLRFSLSAAILFLVGPLFAADAPTKVPNEPANMRVLFNGKDLSGWDGDDRLWTVKEGVIHGETTPELVAAGNTFLILQGDRLKDFDLRLSFRCNATNNSGIQ